MGRKRKIAAIEEEKENEDESIAATQGPMYVILSSAQLNETLHKRYIKEMKQLYEKMNHDAYIFTFIKILKTVLEADDINEFGNTALLFCAKLITSFESDGTHPVLESTFRWLLSTVSNNPHIRYRICYFVNLILKEFGLQAALDDAQCDRILEYMLERLRDVTANVRKQAILAMQRLQMPDNPNDPVLRAYQFHLSSDPSPMVRQCVITCMGRNYHTIPYILDRLWDVDEKVRRHTYMNMCSYPVRSYKVSQRLTLLEQGLNDGSENVRKTVIKYMLKQWIESYQQDLIALTAALKLDSTEDEMQRFRKVAKQMLMVVFKQQKNCTLVAQLPLMEDCEMHRCVKHEDLNIETALYWNCLSDYFQQTQAEEHDLVLPELSIFCTYIKKYCEFQKPDMDKFAIMEFQYIMLSLVEILHSYDLGDEIGRNNLKNLLNYLLSEVILDHKIVEVCIRCLESLITDTNERMQFLLDVIYNISDLFVKKNEWVHDRNLISQLLDNLDADLQMKISSLKVKILELEEQEEDFIRQKDYVKAQAANDEKNIETELYMNTLRALSEKHMSINMPDRPKNTRQQNYLKGLQITFYMVASEHVHALNPNTCKLFHDFISRHLSSNDNEIREWAMKCGTAFAMLYEGFSKELFAILYLQFFKSNSLRVWNTSVKCIFDLLDRYGVEYFNDNGQPAKKTAGRVLYNTLEFLDVSEEQNVSSSGDQTVGVIRMMLHFIDTCDDLGIIQSIVKGLCQLVLQGHVKDYPEVIEKLLKVYFHPQTDSAINQILSVFLEHVIEMRLQNLLQPYLIPMLSNVMHAYYDSAMSDVSPENIVRFFIDLTVQEISTPHDNIHNKIALSFLQEMHNNAKERKDFCKLLSKELLNLKLNLGTNMELKEEMKLLTEKLIKAELDPRTIRNIVNFKSMLDGVFNPPLRNATANDSDDDCDSETITTASEYTNPATNESDGGNPSEDVSAAVSENPPSHTLTENTETNEIVTESQMSVPISTTFGKDNHLGITNLRRSLHKSISQSDVESSNEANEKQQQDDPERRVDVERAKKLTRRNLKRYPTIEQLEASIATTGAKTLQNQENQETSDANSSAGNVTTAAAVDETNKEDEHNSSDVIDASPTAVSPRQLNGSRLRLRSARIKAANSKVQQEKSTNDETKDTPRRNGRKRLLRKTAKEIVSDQSPSEISPLRKKQQRSHFAKPREQQKETPTVIHLATTSLDSPTDSTSSRKENEAPTTTTAAVRSAKTGTNNKTNGSNAKDTNKSTKKTQAASAIRSSRRNQLLCRTPIADAGKDQTKSQHTTTSAVMATRNSARISSMCMTRKRLSLEMTTSAGRRKSPTPKRPQLEKSMGRPTRSSASSNDWNVGKSDSNTSIISNTSTSSSDSSIAAIPRRLLLSKASRIETNSRKTNNKTLAPATITMTPTAIPQRARSTRLRRVNARK